MTYQIASRSVHRCKTGKGDDPRYTQPKQEYGFWKTAFWKLYLPEALFQSVIALPFTVPFRGGGTVPPVGAGELGDGQIKDIVRMVGVGVFVVGFALEVLADTQLRGYKGKGLQRGGVWSIVRHPKYVCFPSSFSYISYLALNC